MCAASDRASSKNGSGLFARIARHHARISVMSIALL